MERSRDSSSSSGNLVGEKKKNKKRNCLRGEAVAVDTDRGSPESDSQCESEGEDDDDVFLESWEEVAAAASVANGQGELNSRSS